MQTRYAFFLKWAGYSYDPAKETKQQGRARCAKSLAAAESAARDAGLHFEWSIDRDTDSSDFDDSRKPWALWQCVMLNADGQSVGALGGIDFGRDGTPWGDPYREVVEAELAQEIV